MIDYFYGIKYNEEIFDTDKCSKFLLDILCNDFSVKPEDVSRATEFPIKFYEIDMIENEFSIDEVVEYISRIIETKIRYIITNYEDIVLFGIDRTFPWEHESKSKEDIKYDIYTSIKLFLKDSISFDEFCKHLYIYKIDTSRTNVIEISE